MNNRLERRTGQQLALILIYILVGAYFTKAIPQPEPEPEPEPEADPLPAFIYNNEALDDSESLLLLKRLKQLVERKHVMLEEERELMEEHIAAASAAAAAKAALSRITDLSEEDPQILPVPSALVHHGPLQSGKRTSYMALCHFKICNMGRKRQI